jgi:hypothetical protein
LFYSLYCLLLLGQFRSFRCGLYIDSWCLSLLLVYVLSTNLDQRHLALFYSFQRRVLSSSRDFRREHTYVPYLHLPRHTVSDSRFFKPCHNGNPFRTNSKDTHLHPQHRNAQIWIKPHSDANAGFLGNGTGCATLRDLVLLSKTSPLHIQKPWDQGSLLQRISHLKFSDLDRGIEPRSAGAVFTTSAKQQIEAAERWRPWRTSEKSQ